MAVRGAGEPRRSRMVTAWLGWLLRRMGTLTVIVTGSVCGHGDLTGPAAPGWLSGEDPSCPSPGVRGLRRALRLYVVINRVLPGPEAGSRQRAIELRARARRGCPWFLTSLSSTPVRARPAAGRKVCGLPGRPRAGRPGRRLPPAAPPAGTAPGRAGVSPAALPGAP